MLDDKGAIKNTVTIFGYFRTRCKEGRDVGNEVLESDPAWIPHREQARRKEALEASLNAYMTAMTAAFQNGEPIPTLEEFEARTQE
ncbi:hypothetical protein LTR56_000170 [Elasticomyces elasticus]|nr:hypothetical protein LTR56_000170 [Elasticomyces elasticus]KAK3667158.1 hypothetical protein LTR22_002023 [Elasticomyces elasticus]KAK4932932.1 hypothetical protein LTR49_000889 [Elasticomyces elasticus]KAK5768663.1 hypothetical protein LTS12_001088 [Elasticomyces elasticus]